MSLKAFHLVFIGASTLLAFGFAAWCLAAGPAGAGAGRLLAGGVSVAGGIGLVAYEAWFVRTMRGVS